jgi:hypothetical protein
VYLGGGACVGAGVGEEEVVCVREEVVRVVGMGVVEIKEEIVGAIVVKVAVGSEEIESERAVEIDVGLKVAGEVVFVCAVMGRAIYVSSDINSLDEEWRGAMVGELYVSLGDISERMT